MARYRLIYRADGTGPTKQVEFDGQDPARALQFAHRETGARAAELWQGGRKLCTIHKVGGKPDYWMIGPGRR